MVSILPNQRSPWDVIGSQIGQNLHQTLPGAVQQGYNRGQLQNSLGELSSISKSGGSPLEVTLAAMKAGAGIPGSERYLGQLIPLLQQMSAANASGKVGFGQEGSGQPRVHEPVEPMQQRQQLPGFAGQPNQNFPTNLGPQNAPGNLPQPATTGKVKPLRTPEEKRKDAIQGAKRSTAEGLPITPKEYLEQFINPEEADKKSHNDEVESERKQRVASQKNYGEKAVKALEKVHSGATAEQKSIFAKKGEEAASRGDSEAEIDRYLSKEADKFKNMMVNVQKDMSAPRLHNMIARAANGTYKDLKQSGDDLRSHLKPLLDLGLYDTARDLLSNQGYGPEERDAIINPLNERANIALNRISSSKKASNQGIGAGFVNGIIPGVAGALGQEIARNVTRQPSDLSDIKEGLLELKKADPNFSLPLARKAFEDKNYDWRDFKDALNELEAEGFKLETDQEIQRGVLDTPPLSTLEKLLHGLNIVGR